MLIREWMTTEVVTVTPETSMLKASRLMKEYKIRRLPVLDEQRRVVGIVSDRDIRDASPSKATTLDVHELHYLLAELKVKGIMSPAPVTIAPTDTVESAVTLMESKGFGGLPVVHEDGTIAGIITDHDIYRAFIAISGARLKGIQLAFSLDDEPGVMRPILDTLLEHRGNIISVLTAVNGPGVKSQVYIRIRPLDKDSAALLVEALKARMGDSFVYWVDEQLHEIVEQC